MSKILLTSEDLPARFSSQQQLQSHVRCRICLGEQKPQESLPCNCKSDLGRIHNKCFKKWVQYGYDVTPQKVMVVNCEICKVPIAMQLITRKRLKNCQEMKKTQSICCGVCLLLAVVALLLVYWPIISGLINMKQINTPMLLLYIMIMIFLLIFLKFTLQAVFKIFTKSKIISLKFINHCTAT